MQAAPQQFEIKNFSMGVDWTSHDTQIPDGFVADAKNCVLNSWMGLEKRKGCTKLYSTAYNSGTAIKSLYEYKAPNGTNYILVSSGNNLGYYSGGAWYDLRYNDSDLVPPSGGLTSGLRCSFATHDGYCYVVNGTDLNFKLKNNSMMGIVGIAAPTAAPTLEITSTGLTGKYKYVFCYTHDADPDLGIPERRGNISPASASIEPLNQGIKITGKCGPAYDSEIKKIILYRTLDLGAGDTDSTQYFKVAEVPNTLAASTTLGEEFIGTGSDDLVGLATTLDNVDIWVKILLATSGVGAYLHKPGTNDPVHDVTTTNANAAVGFAIRILDNKKYKLKNGPIHDGTWQGGTKYDCLETGNTYGTTLWHFDLDKVDLIAEDKYIDYEFKNVGADVYTVSVDHGLTWGGSYSCSATLNTYGETTWRFTLATGHTVGTYWKITSGTTTGWTYTDTTVDDDLTTMAEVDNTPPPRAKFICLHKDRMIYANCQKDFNGAEIPGGSCMFMFSSVGAPEKCPSTNYQFFDRSDGNEITGIASIPDYLIVFKKNKIAAMEGEFAQWYTISNGIGCIAPWSITVVGGKVYFISEEGYKATDGKAVYDVGKRLGALSRAQYFTDTASVEYTSVYYPEKFQIHINFYHATLNNIVLVAHLLDTLYQEVGVNASVGETAPTTAVGYTYHEYDYHASTHALRTLGTYTDATGVERPIAGSDDGFVYLLDSGVHDTGYDDAANHIAINVETGWTPMGAPEQITKTLRGIHMRYSSDVTAGSGSALLYYDVDFTRGSNSVALTGGGAAYTGGPMGTANYNFLGVTENLGVIDSAVGRMFRYRLYDLSHNNFCLLEITPYFRLENRR